jgi:hypothetical protein
MQKHAKVCILRKTLKTCTCICKHAKSSSWLLHTVSFKESFSPNWNRLQATIIIDTYACTTSPYHKWVSCNLELLIVKFTIEFHVFIGIWIVFNQFNSIKAGWSKKKKKIKIGTNKISQFPGTVSHWMSMNIESLKTEAVSLSQQIGYYKKYSQYVNCYLPSLFSNPGKPDFFTVLILYL